MPKGLILAVAMILAAGQAMGDVATTSYSAGAEGPHPGSLKISKADGASVITVALTGLGKGTKVHRARLLAARGQVGDPKDLLGDIEVYAGGRRSGKPHRGKPPLRSEPKSPRLPLVGPVFRSFDATAAVREALSAGGELKLLVRKFPAWRQEATRLEVVFEGKAEPAPPAVTELKAFHHAGQTFLTWKEVDPPVAAGTCTWGEYRKAIAGAKDACTYRIYAHDKPIDGKTFLQAEHLGETGAGSCWNVNGRNIEYLIAQAMIKTDRTGELAFRHNSEMYTWGPDSERMDRYPLERLAIPLGGELAVEPSGRGVKGQRVAPPAGAGPVGVRLPPGTGLFVHTPAKPQKRYYAVIACRGGVENTADIPCAGPVAETAGAGEVPEPVCQGKGLHGPYFDHPGTRWLYVQWGTPQTAPNPNMYFNWTVFIPRDMPESGKAQAELHLYDPPWTHARPRHKLMRRSVQLCTQDRPFSGWYGYHEAYGTLKGYAGGKVRPHTQRRILALLEWAGRSLPIDPDRVMLYGSDGAALLGMSCPEPFAYVLTTRFSGQVLTKDAPARFGRPWGPQSAKVTDPAGRGEWGWAMLDEVALATRAKDLPAFYCRGYSWGRHRQGAYKGEGRFYDAMRKANHPIVANWTWASGQLLPPNKYTGTWRGREWTRRTPVPALANCSLDSGRMHDANTNARVGVEVTRDAAGVLEAGISSHADATFDLAFRRLQQFKVAAGRKLRWEAVSIPQAGFRGKKPDPQSGAVTVDDDGVFVLKALKNTGRCKLKLKVTLLK